MAASHRTQAPSSPSCAHAPAQRPDEVSSQPGKSGWGSSQQRSRKPARPANNGQFLWSEIARVHLRVQVTVYPELRVRGAPGWFEGAFSNIPEQTGKAVESSHIFLFFAGWRGVSLISFEPKVGLLNY